MWMKLKESRVSQVTTPTDRESDDMPFETLKADGMASRPATAQMIGPGSKITSSVGGTRPATVGGVRGQGKAERGETKKREGDEACLSEDVNLLC